MLTAAVAVVAASAAGVASASGSPALAWSQGGPTVSSYDFGTIDGVGYQTASQTFTLTNNGDVLSGALTVSLTGPAAFTDADGCSGKNLGAGKSCSVTVVPGSIRLGLICSHGSENSSPEPETRGTVGFTLDRRQAGLAGQRLWRKQFSNLAKT